MRLAPSVLAVFATAFSVLSALQTLDDRDLQNIPSGKTDWDITTGALLAPILIPRVPGTEGSFKVQHHFASFFKENLPGWKLIWQNSTSKTPATGDKQIPFSNLIFTRDPPWAQDGDVSRLTLVAHYDSKYSPPGFIGAVDSAAPCAMLMHVARSIDDALTAKWKDMQEMGEDHGLEGQEGIQIIFLDGEEAFLQWTDDDSLYGARSLAEAWEDTFHPAMSSYRTPLDSISLFVLLDLLGSTESTIPSYFETTHWTYRNMGEIEKRMRALNLLKGKPKSSFFPETDREGAGRFRGGIADDHIPFLNRGVDILHLIPSPFPPTWHKMEDDGEHLDLAAVDDWAKIVTAFSVGWMDIKDYMPKAKVTGEKRSETSTALSEKTEL